MRFPMETMTLGNNDSFFEALEVVAPNGIDKYYAPSFK
jgi:hypothetical protein